MRQAYRHIIFVLVLFAAGMLLWLLGWLYGKNSGEPFLTLFFVFGFAVVPGITTLLWYILYIWWPREKRRMRAPSFRPHRNKR